MKWKKAKPRFRKEVEKRLAALQFRLWKRHWPGDKSQFETHELWRGLRWPQFQDRRYKDRTPAQQRSFPYVPASEIVEQLIPHIRSHLHAEQFLENLDRIEEDIDAEEVLLVLGARVDE